MEEDPKKIEKIIETLNKGLKKEEWVWEDAEDFHMWSTVKDNNGRLAVNPSQGVVAKLFINKKTGELRQYYWKEVLKD